MQLGLIKQICFSDHLHIAVYLYSQNRVQGEANIKHYLLLQANKMAMSTCLHLPNTDYTCPCDMGTSKTPYKLWGLGVLGSEVVY